MKKSILSLILVIIFFSSFFLNVKAALDVNGVGLFRDGNVCILDSNGNPSTLNLASIQTTIDSVQARLSSSGTFCKPGFFLGGTSLSNTSGITIQGQPVIQANGRGILISEMAGVDGGVSSSGEPREFNSLINRFSGVDMLFFEATLPSGCDVLDDDDDGEGSSTALSSVNDFSLLSCSATGNITPRCNDFSTSGLISAINVFVPASSGSPAKIRFGISNFNVISDSAILDAYLLKLDSQDIFCSSSATAPLTVSIVAKNSVTAPTITETIGNADLGSPIKALGISFSTETATSLKGELSTNNTSSTPLLKDAVSTLSNTFQISELDNDAIPVGGISSQSLIDPALILTNEITLVHLWITPSKTNVFSAAPTSSDITFSDNSLALSSNPYLVRSSTDDSNAPVGTVVIPIKKNDAQGASNPNKNKTKITVKNIGLNTISASDSTISVLIFEPSSLAVVNTPGIVSINNTSSPTNPQNYSAFSSLSNRSSFQNAIISTIVNETSMNGQITTDADLTLVTARNKTLGSPQIEGFTTVVTSVSPIDTSKVTATNASNVLTITGSENASISGGKIKIDLTPKGSSIFDSVTITTGEKGSFTAKLKTDFSKGDATLSFKQTVSGVDSIVSTKTVSSSTLSCEKTVCGCENLNCSPSAVQVLNFIKDNGGLSSIVSSGGSLLDEVISSAKKALGLS